MDNHLLPHPTSTNILFLGETNIGESSILDLATGPREQDRPRYAGGYERSVTLNGKTFGLRASPTNESTSTAVLREGIQDALMDLRSNGGVHLLVYCMNALHSMQWIYDVHQTIVSHSALSPHVPTVAVVAGIPDPDEQERWWSSNEDSFAGEGLHFDDHTFIQTTATGVQSPTGDHISESRRLHTLILQNYSHAPSSEKNSCSPYKQGILGNSLQSLSTMLAGKAPSHVSANSKAIDIVLLGEIGVGKSSLINLIAKKNVAQVSSDTVGCTKAAVKYTFEEKGRTFRLYDTPGLVDPQMGIEPFVNPIDTIHKLIRTLGNGDGPDLLLFCIDNSKPTAALQRNYRLFYEFICRGKVPFTLVITKLEEGQDANEWWGRHRATIRKYGIHHSGYFGLGQEKRHSGSSADTEMQLRESLLLFLAARADRQRNRMSLLRFSKARTVVSSLGRTPQKTLMKECGLEEQIAQQLAERITFLKEPCNGKART